MIALLALLATASSADVLVLDLKPVGVDETETRVLDGLFAEAVGKEVATWPQAHRPRVATGNDIRTMITLEANKAAAGCDDAGCLAEIAGAFGAHYVVTGTLGRLGSQRVLQAWLYDVVANQTLARESVTANDASALTTQLDGLARRVLVPLAPEHKESAAKSKGDGGGSGLSTALVVTGVSVAAVAGVVGVGAGAWALALDGRLAAGSGATPTEKREALASGPAVVVTSALGGVAAAIGLAVLGVGVAVGGE